MQNHTKAHETAWKHAKAHKSTRKHAKLSESLLKHMEACGSSGKLFFGRPSNFFCSQYKSLLHFLGGGGGRGCVCRSLSMDSLLLSIKVGNYVNSGVFYKYCQKLNVNPRGEHRFLWQWQWYIRGATASNDTICQAWATSGSRATCGPPSTLMWPTSFIFSFLYSFFYFENILKSNLSLFYHENP